MILTMPLGFFENDWVYGAINSRMTAAIVLYGFGITCLKSIDVAAMLLYHMLMFMLTVIASANADKGRTV